MWMRSALVAYLVVGLMMGALAGYLTRPESAQIVLGPLKIEMTGERPAHGNGPLTASQVRHVAAMTALGGVIGLALGFVLGRGRG